MISLINLFKSLRPSFEVASDMSNLSGKILGKPTVIEGGTGGL